MDNDIFNRVIMARTQTPGTQVVIQNKDSAMFRWRA